MNIRKTRIALYTTDELRALLDEGAPVVALIPVGSVEPHGPHLPLATDTMISESSALRAAELLSEEGIVGLVAPPIPYGVTRFADGFAGAIHVPGPVLTAFARAVGEGYLAAGFAHVCLVNNHLEPAQDAAIRAALEGLPTGKASVACPLTRRWGKTLSPEFKSGACHAGRYETSLVLAAAPEAVASETAKALPDLEISLSDGIKLGQSSFRSMGMTRAYTGAPAQASAEEGRDLREKLATMIASEVLEALSSISQDSQDSQEPS